MGIVARQASSDNAELSLSLRDWRSRDGNGTVIVAGWAMDNMKPRDFILSVEPFLNLEPDAEDILACLVNASNAAANALREALLPLLGGGAGKPEFEAREAEREAFFIATEQRFMTHLASLKAGDDPREVWVGDLRSQALQQFDARALPGIAQRKSEEIMRIVEARKGIGHAFAGYGRQGKAIFDALGMLRPDKKGGIAA